MQLQVGDRLADQSEEWELASCRTPRLENLAATIGGAPFLIPDLETSDVQLKGPHAGFQWDPFHQQLGLREDRVAGVARFPVARTTPNRSNAVTGQAPGSELRRMRRRRASWSIVQSNPAHDQCHLSAIPETNFLPAFNIPSLDRMNRVVTIAHRMRPLS